MARIIRFDKSRRKHWRSDAQMKRMAKMTARAIKRDQRAKQRINWKIAVAGFVLTVIIGQLCLWEYQDMQARHAALAAFPADKVWRNCDEARAAGVAPLFRGETGYSPFLDADNDGVACEPYIGNANRQLRWRSW